jgi:subtilisin family serine protease
MGHRTMAGGRIARRPALAAALLGLVLAGAGLVPAIAADSGAEKNETSSRRSAAKAKSARAGRTKSADTRDRLVVRTKKPGTREEEKALAASVGGDYGGRIEPGEFRLDVEKGQGPTAIRQLRANQSVEWVANDIRFHSAELAPAGEKLSLSGEPTASGAATGPLPVNERCFAGCALTFDSGATSRIYSQSDFLRIGATEAWSVTHGDPEMLVAVIDTDVDPTHPDLAGKVIIGPNFSCSPTAPKPEPGEKCTPDETPDPEGHATAVAGLIAAVPNNGVGIAGLGWDTKVLSVRVLDSQGNGLASNIADGIRYAAEYPGVKIINLSLQQEPDQANDVSEPLRKAIQFAQSKGVLVVSAAGNQPESTPSYPANFEGVLSVAAVDGADDRLAKFSRHGPWVDIAAPGVGVLTLATPCADGNCWVTPDGTSFATPIVSAAAALVWAANPKLTAQQVASRLMSTADSIPGTGTDFSSGQVNVGRAVAGASAMPVTPLQVAPPGVATSTAVPPLPVGPTGKGYWLVASDGGIFSFGNAAFLGSTGGLTLNKPIVGMAATPSGKGYWMVASDGGIFAFGDAGFFGSTGALQLNRPIVGMTATPSGKGYWLTASDGGIFAFGDARFLGSTGAMTLNKPIVGMSATPSGRGYWLVASDGGIFSFGDARFYGSTGNIKLNEPIVDLAPSPDGDGYWMVASDGGVFAFGSSAFYGAPAGAIAGTAIALAAAPAGNGYWIVGSDGSIYNFGAANHLGSLGGTPLNRPMVGLAIR